MSSRLKPLSARAVESLKSCAFVGGAPGLELRVHGDGVRSWRLLYRLPGAPRRRSIKLGRYPDLGLAEARKLAQKKLALAADGHDPALEREQRIDALSNKTADVLDRYLDWCQTENDPKTVSDKSSALRNALLPVLGTTPIGSITRVDILALLDRCVDRPGLRRVTHAYLRHFLGWCCDRGLAVANPMIGLRPPRPVPARERILSDEEIRALWLAQGVYALIARLCLLTAQRRSTLEAMRWSDVDLVERVWRIPAGDMKSGKAHEVPLSDLVVDLLSGLHRLEGPFVFGVGTNGAAPYGGASNGMDGLRAQLHGKDWRRTGVDTFRLHDLRRTAVTLAQRGGASIEEIRALTQHKTPGVIGVYARHAYADEKRRVVDIIASQVTAILAART
jgi:integrase